MKFNELPDFKVKLKHVAFAGIACIALYGAAYGMVEATNQTPFCGETCHEMDPMYTSWQQSGHAKADVGCADCHEKPGLQGTIESKWKGTKELVMHVSGNVPDPIKMENPNDVNCYTCHQGKMMNVETAAAAKDPHTMKHFENGMTCLTCHTGVTHDTNVNMTVPSRERCYTCHLDSMSK